MLCVCHLDSCLFRVVRVSYKNVKQCCDLVDDIRSEKLRSQLHRYLECEPPEAAVSALSFARESDAMAAKDSEIQVGSMLHHLDTFVKTRASLRPVLNYLPRTSHAVRLHKLKTIVVYVIYQLTSDLM